MEMKSRVPLLLLATSLCFGCVSWDDMRRAWEANYRDVLLPGYTDFRAEQDGTEDGYVIYSYELPQAVSPLVGLLKQHISAAYPCYKVITETSNDLVLRCPGGRARAGSGSKWDEEFRFHVDAKTRRVFVFAIDSVQRTRYAEYVTFFNDHYGTSGFQSSP
jgi:hypothetical protein